MTQAGRTSGRTTRRERPGKKKAAAPRSPLPAALPRPAKLDRDRSAAVPPPAHVRTVGLEITDDDRERIRLKLGRKLGKFASAIERVTVRLSDANGPRGGRDQVCGIKVVLSALPSVVVEERDPDLQRAVDRAVNAVFVAVRRSLQRRRSKPLRRRPTPRTAKTS